MEETGLVCLARGDATRIDPTTAAATKIDITLTCPKIATRCTWEVLEENLGSDHFVIRITTELKPRTEPQKQGGLNTKKANWAAYKQEIQRRITPSLPHENLEDNANFIVDNIMAAARSCIPPRGNNTSRALVPYWNTKCAEAVKERNRAFHLHRLDPTEENRLNHCNLKRLAQKTIRNEQDQHWRDVCTTLTPDTPSTKLWNTISSMQGASKQRSIPEITSRDGRPLSNEEKANIFAEFFASNSSDNNLDPAFLNRKSNQPAVIIPTIKPEHHLSSCITLKEIRRALKNTRKSAPGSDEITYDLIKQLPAPALQALKELFNQSWLSGRLPSSWRLATVIPIRKKDKPADLCTSYRPISLTSVLCKLLEKILAARLDGYMEIEQLYSQAQSGFRKHRGCGEQIARLAHDAALATNRFSTVAVFLDVEKAFDMVWREGIIARMVQLQIPSRMTTWVREFLSERRLQVRIGNVSSKETVVENGTPQGSVLSPLLFNIAMSSLPDHPGTKHSVYADDIAIWTLGDDTTEMTDNIQDHLDSISSHLKNNGFRISAEKSQSILFTRSTKVRMKNFTLSINGTCIPRVKTAKFLGVNFDEIQNFRTHAMEVAQRCEKRLNIMRMLSGIRWGANRSSLLTVYRAMVRPLLDYGCEGIEHAPKYVKTILDKIQNKALSICCGSMRGTPVAALHIECCEPPLDLRRKRLITNLAAKTRYTRNNPTRDTYFPPDDLPRWMKNRERALQEKLKTRNPAGFGPDTRLIAELLDQPDPNQTPSYESIKQNTLLRLVDEWQDRWDKGPTARALHQIQNKVALKKDPSNMQREKEVLISRLRMGHCRLNEKLHRLGIKRSGCCHFCPDTPEDVTHYLLDCPARKEMTEELQNQPQYKRDLATILGDRNCQDLIYKWTKIYHPEGL